jgi:hypothetical protein
MRSEGTGINGEKRSLGVTIIAIVNFMFGLGGISVGLSGLYIQLYLSFCALATGFVLLIAGVGLLELKSWAWYLTVGGCISSLTVYVWLQPHWFPLEIVVLPYLIWKRKSFGVMKEKSKMKALSIVHSD